MNDLPEHVKQEAEILTKAAEAADEYFGPSGLRVPDKSPGEAFLAGYSQGYQRGKRDGMELAALHVDHEFDRGHGVLDALAKRIRESAKKLPGERAAEGEKP